MQISREQISPTKLKLTLVADTKALEEVKSRVLVRVSQNVKVPGFRPGKAPSDLVAKQIDPTALQSEFLEEAINQFYSHAVDSEKLRPVAQPTISVTKFVPYSTLEFTAEVEAVGEIQLPDYKKIKLARKKSEVTADEVSTILNNLRQRAASKEEVKRAAKQNDEVTLDFKGVDAKTKESIAGADGENYPLVIGSQRFIPGFEEELIGLKAGDEKDFVITFPKDYGTKNLQSKKVSFHVKVSKVDELKEPKADDAFAATVGQFKTLAELKADIKKQLAAEKKQEADRAYDNELLEKIAAKSTVAIPDSLIKEEIDRMEEDEKRNIVYRGQTWQEHLDAEGVTAKEHHAKQRPAAELRVKAGLILGEIAQKEQISVTPEELEVRVQLLKGQYSDPAMLAEIDKPENRRDIMSRMLTEKALDKLRSYADS